MHLLQKLVACHEEVGRKLVPYYRQLLPVFNLCMGSNKNLGDAIDYGQNHTPCLGELAASTLSLLELHGGPTAFINIKYMVRARADAALLWLAQCWGRDSPGGRVCRCPRTSLPSAAPEPLSGREAA